jgi:hypothetical protein
VVTPAGRKALFHLREAFGMSEKAAGAFWLIPAKGASRKANNESADWLGALGRA